MNMKTWTNPSVEELEVEMTAGGQPWWFWEDRRLGPVDGDEQDPVTPPANDDQENGEQEPGKDETPDGLS
jgi:hypothetical protein